MSKSILVIDTPTSCSECPLFNGFYSDMTCRANSRSINYPYPENFRQDWCPLSPIPTLSHSQLLKPDKEAIEKRDAFIKDVKLRHEDDGTMIVEVENVEFLISKGITHETN